ncbi:hypothetical protein [Iningainema tapete]|uniref:Uncharacterized protein n=1 Tax=Iningainema tapete BLCC-T55 TaxID=2748662 RepID=A0A8J6XPV0_9CYAN|nr:hypothetical protein [Iningainema tapete]MBD2775975.1 hypothetical protein [Iningainema tapete BLCC-T55]
MNYCPCCSHTLLRHIRGHEVYWFCRNCWQEMPVLTWNHFTKTLHNPKQDLATVGMNKREAISEWIEAQLPQMI